MAYRRKHGVSRAATFSFPSEDHRSNPEDTSSSSSSLAAQAIRASSAHRDSSLSSAYGESAYRDWNPNKFSPSRQDNNTPYEYTSMRNLNESKYGFWGVLARKAKSILDDDNIAKQFEASKRPNRPDMLETPADGQFHQSNQSPDGNQKAVSPKFQKGLEAITSSLNYIGGTIGNALEEGLTIVENRTADIISETRKLQLRRRAMNFSEVGQQQTNLSGQWPPAQMTIQADQETQLKASRDVAMAMAAKAKLLLRELKTVKADFAFAKERCAQLEEENKILRESHEKGDTPEDDDLIRLQLETLLAEKARLANENSVYARENRFLREIVEYHQLTMQDVVYVDEGHEEVTEVYPIPIPPVVVDVRPTLTPSPGVELSSPTSTSSGRASPNPTAVEELVIAPLMSQLSSVSNSAKNEKLLKRQNSTSSSTHLS